MIELIKGRIYWHEAAANTPGLELLLSRRPRLEEHRFEQRQDCYYSEVDGVCSFFSWDGRPDRGYGGATFTLTMLDGSTKDLVGPWSSSSQVMNSLGFGPCTEVNVTDDPESYERGFTFSASAVTMAWLGRYRDRIWVPPFRFSSINEPWKGFDRRLVFPEGSRFTMLQITPDRRSTRGPVRMDHQVDPTQGLLLGQFGGFVPIVELPDGGYWVKPQYRSEVPVPQGGRVEEIEERPGLGPTYLGVPE